MIQRPQSLYLLIGAVAFLALFFFDLAWESPAANSYTWFTPVVLMMAGVLGLGAIGTIFLYGDRKRQRSIVVGLQVATIAFLLLFLGGIYLVGDLHFARDGVTAAGKVIAMLLPILAYAMFFMARRGITKDIALVRSMDRLR
jgi:uncharacterized membrane protein